MKIEEVRLLSVKDICNILGISTRNAYTMFHRRDFPAIKLGKRLYVRESTFMSWITKMEQTRI